MGPRCRYNAGAIRTVTLHAGGHELGCRYNANAAHARQAAGSVGAEPVGETILFEVGGVDAEGKRSTGRI